ncbi:MAG: ComEC/Rec2 family competence protein [bacterium]|nr:ComEC/Rec2 family competence protein [bacterium]
MFSKRLKIRFPFSEHQLLSALLGVSLVFVGLSFWLFRYRELKIYPPLQGRSRLSLEFVVDQEPRVKGNFKTLTYRGVLISVPKDLVMGYGDRISVSGYLEAGQKFLVHPRVKIIEGHSGWGSEIRQVVSRFRQLLSLKISSLLPEPQAALLKGIVLGIRSNLPWEFSEQLKKTGTVHVVVASGYNISFLAKVMSATTRFMGAKISLAVTMVTLLFYSLLAGWEPPIIRALFMGSLVCWGEYFGRPVSVLRLLIFSAVIMLILDPLLIDDLSFQLSFLSTFSLLTIEPWLAKIFPYSWLENFWASLASQIVVWPLIAFYFGTVSIWSPLTNLLVLWSVEPAMIFGLLPILVPVRLTFLSRVATFLSLIPLTYFVKYVGILSQLPLSLLPIRLSQSWLLLYYLLLVAVTFFLLAVRGRRPHEA